MYGFGLIINSYYFLKNCILIIKISLVIIYSEVIGVYILVGVVFLVV